MKLLFNFLVPFLVGMMAIPLLIKVSRKTNFLVDVPEGDALKIHEKSIPLLGGLAMLISLAVSLFFFWEPKMAGMLGGFLIIFFLGFYDDLKWKHVSTIKPLLKFALLLGCSLAAAATLLPMGASLLLAFLYIFVCMNAVNYQDGMDGLAGGLVSISLVGFLCLGLVANIPLAVVISLVCLGAVTAFLQFNYSPAKIFMGDSGAYSLGFILAALALMFLKPHNFYSVLGPIFIIGLPIFDVVFTNVRRLAAGKSIFLGDRSHFYDKLLQKGFSTKKTLVICYGFQLVLAIIGVTMYII